MRLLCFIQLASSALLLSACANAQPAVLQAPIVVPFELRGDAALVKVDVNGRPTTLILDTGSGALVLDSAFAREAEIEMSSHVQGRAEGSRSVPVKIGTARTVRVGSAPLVNVMVAVVDLAAVRARVGHDVRGTVGFELFDRYVVEMDFEARTITLHEPKAYSYSGAGTVLPIRIERRLPVVEAGIVTRRSGTLPARLIVDLGSSNWSVRLATKFVAAHDLERDTVAVTGPFGAGVGGATEGQLMRMPALVLGALTIARPSVALSHEPDGAFGATAATDGTIGVPVFRRTRMIIDYARTRLILEPRGRLDVPDSVDASGLSLVADAAKPGALRVAYVVAGSAGAQAGVRVGDEVTEIDGRTIASMTRQDAVKLLRASGTTRAIVVRRGDATMRLSLVLRMII